MSSLFSQVNEGKDLGLKEYYKDYFPIGVAVSPRSLQGESANLILKHFNSMTPENVMKMGPIHPEKERYNWQFADEIVDFAQKNHLLLRGHALCWHNQAGDWIFKDDDRNQVTKEVFLQRLKEHITTVVGRYKGKIYAWDVVNEAVSDKEGEFLRNSEWYKICGADYIIKAFEYAHEVDPDMKLFYNDYSAVRPSKRDKIYKLVRMIQDAGVPIHGVGIQGHFSIYEPTEQELRDALELYASLGVEVQITELDVSVYQKEHSRRDSLPKDKDDAFKPEQEHRQIEQYDMLFRVFREYKETLTGVTFWNVSDQHSWLDNFPVHGRKNYPLLFDEDLKPKKAYYRVVEFAREKPQ
ncbi:MAG: endo-1,4-beta-xylanase [Allomuricauda sp.]